MVNFRTLYLLLVSMFHRRPTVQEKAIMKQPGNNIPVFQKNELLEELDATCTYKPCGFTKEGIQKCILDTLNERCQRIKKGHDYTKLYYNDLVFSSLLFSILFFSPE